MKLDFLENKKESSRPLINTNWLIQTNRLCLMMSELVKTQKAKNLYPENLRAPHLELEISRCSTYIYR